MSTAAQLPTEIRIGDTLYDAKGMKHPGGSIIKFYMGSGDATEAFEEMHMRSKTAYKMLKVLPQRPAPKSVTESKYSQRTKQFTADFGKLVKDLRKEGWYDFSPSETLYRIAEIVVMHVVGFWLLLNGWVMPGLVVLGIVQGRCGWYMHEGGHHSITTNINLDHRLQEFFYGFGCGMSGQWWRIQHNKHHAMPQKLKHDVDLDTLPFVAFNKACYDILPKKGLVAKLFVPVQAYIFAPISCFIIASTWQFLMHPRHVMRRKLYAEGFWMALRYAFIAGVAAYAGASLGTVVALYCAYNAIGGTYIFVNFALSHTHLDIAMPTDEVHWLEYASVHTLNCTPHWFTNWWMAYLNFQIEHHLFPSMPQHRFVKLWPRVKKLFEANGLKYDCRDYFPTLVTTFKNLHSVSRAIAEGADM